MLAPKDWNSDRTFKVWSKEPLWRKINHDDSVDHLKSCWRTSSSGLVHAAPVLLKQRQTTYWDILIFMLCHEFWDSHYPGPPGLHKPLNAEEDWLWLRQVPHYVMHRVFHYHNNWWQQPKRQQSWGLVQLY